MAMVKCPECGSEVSSSATSCPKCGKVHKKKSGCGKKLLIVLGVIIGIGVIASLSNSGGSSSSSSGGSSSSPPSRNEVTYSEYLRVENGMSYDEVVEIIGFEGEELGQSHVEGVEGFVESVDTHMYSWQNSNGSNMNVMFQNDKVISKAQFGLD